MRIEYTPVGSTELNLIFCPNLEIGTGRYHRGDHTTSSRNVEHVFNLEKKRHRHFCERINPKMERL